MIFTGNTADGTAYRGQGVYLHPDGDTWSNKPITREQKAYHKVCEHCRRHHLSFKNLYTQIAGGSKENLPKWVRTWFMEMMAESLIDEIKVTLFKNEEE